MPDRPINVLFLCTGNSARSILAEALLDHWGNGRFKGFSAGSIPKGEIHPLTLELLRELKLPTEHLRSKAWDEFAAAAAPVLDYVVTVCDQAAGEVCPIWPGQPIMAHWGVPDPVAARGTPAERMVAFRRAFEMLERRIKLFLAVQDKALHRAELAHRLAEIGRMDGGQAEGAAS